MPKNKPLDARGIALDIEYILSHSGEAEQMEKRGRQVVEQRYNRSIESGKLLSNYRYVLSAVPKV